MEVTRIFMCVYRVFVVKIFLKLLILGLISKKLKKTWIIYATPRGSLLFGVLFFFIIARMHN